MSEVTFVCCYNNFVNSFCSQDTPYELIGINNTGNKKFQSASSAYNSVINQVRTKYVIYSHQDIELTKPEMLRKLVAYLDKIGVAGVKFDQPGIFTNILDMVDRKYDKPTHSYIYVEGKMMECDTLDECFFGGYAQHFRDYPFDEKICNNWHFYAVEACLRTTSNLLVGGTCMDV